MGAERPKNALYVGLAEESRRCVWGEKKKRREESPTEVERRSRNDVCKRCVAAGVVAAVAVGRKSFNLARMEGIGSWMDGMHKGKASRKAKERAKTHTVGASITGRDLKRAAPRMRWRARQSQQVPPSRC